MSSKNTRAPTTAQVERLVESLKAYLYFFDAVVRTEDLPTRKAREKRARETREAFDSISTAMRAAGVDHYGGLIVGWNQPMAALLSQLIFELWCIEKDENRIADGLQRMALVRVYEKIRDLMCFYLGVEHAESTDASNTPKPSAIRIPTGDPIAEFGPVKLFADRRTAIVSGHAKQLNPAPFAIVNAIVDACRKGRRASHKSLSQIKPGYHGILDRLTKDPHWRDVIDWRTGPSGGIGIFDHQEA